MNKKFYASSVRMARFLYALGFDKESFYTESGREKWAFDDSEELRESVAFFKAMRQKNRSSYYGKIKETERVKV